MMPSTCIWLIDWLVGWLDDWVIEWLIEVLTRDVCWGNDAIPRQLPDVELVYGDNALNLQIEMID